jgi:hypothetical protein
VSRLWQKAVCCGQVSRWQRGVNTVRKLSSADGCQVQMDVKCRWMSMQSSVGNRVSGELRSSGRPVRRLVADREGSKRKQYGKS